MHLRVGGRANGTHGCLDYRVVLVGEGLGKNHMCEAGVKMMAYKVPMRSATHESQLGLKHPACGDMS